MLLFLLQVEITQFQAGALFGAIMGVVIGLVPLILGIIKNRVKFGVLGFVGAIIGNTILGIFLSIPIIAVCIYLIFQKNPSKTAPASNISNDSEMS